MSAGVKTEEAQLRRRQQTLLGEVARIDEQLGGRAERLVGGRRMRPAEYYAWRTRALAAKAARLQEHREIRDELRRRRVAELARGVTDRELLEAARLVLERRAGELGQEERLLLEELRKRTGVGV